ncbi:MAG: VWA domain-containing protein [Planctomycetota bacterium]
MGVESWVESWLMGGQLVWRPWVEPMAWAWLAGAVVVMAAGWSWWRTVGSGGWRRAIGSTWLLGMRVLVAGVLVLLLAGPSVIATSATEPTRGVLVMLLDTSASMARDDVAPTRAGRAIETWLSPSVIAAIERTHDVRVRVFDTDDRGADVARLRELGGSAARGDETRLTDALREAIDDAAGSAGTAVGDVSVPWSVVVLSDGRESTDASPLSVAEAARGAGVAVHAAAFGTTSGTPDLALTAEVEPTYLLVDEPGRVRVRVLRGGEGVDEATVRLTRGDEEIVRQVAFNGRRLATVELPITEPTAGTFAYAVSVDAAPGELELRNNHQPVFVDVLADRFRVLLLEGQPTWDTRFIARALRRDERVALTQMTRLSADRLERLTARVRDEDATSDSSADTASSPDALRWADYDVVILGGGMHRLLTDELVASLSDYVGEQGGRVLFAHGRPYDETTAQGRRIAEAWRAIEPVRWGDGVDRAVRVRPRSAAFEHPAFAFSLDGSTARRVIDTLPAVTAVASADAVSPAAEVIATAAGGDAEVAVDDLAPAMVTMPYDRGVVTVILAQGLWRWAMLDGDRQSAAGAWDRFWSNMVRWLALGGAFRPGEDVSLRLSERAVHTGASVWVDVVRRSLDNGSSLSLELEAPDGTTRPLPAQAIGGGQLRQRATIEPDEPGVYRVMAVADGQIAAEAMLSVYDADRERIDTSADPSLLEALANATGGRMLDPDRPAELIALLETQRAARLVPPRPEYLWDKWWVMAVLLSWLGLEWIGRRLAGMI